MATEAPTLSTLQCRKAEKLIIDGQHQPDTWLQCPADTTLDALSGYETENLILPLNCWLEARDQLSQRQGLTGVWLQSNERAESLVDETTTDINSIPLIAVD